MDGEGDCRWISVWMAVDASRNIFSIGSEWISNFWMAVDGWGVLIFWNSFNSFEIRVCDFRRIAHFDSVHFWHFQADWSYIEGDRSLDVFWRG